MIPFGWSKPLFGSKENLPFPMRPIRQEMGSPGVYLDTSKSIRQH